MNKTEIQQAIIPEKSGDERLDSLVEELADYLYVNCPDHYDAVVRFGRARFLQGKLVQINKTIKDMEEGGRE